MAYSIIDTKILRAPTEAELQTKINKAVSLGYEVYGSKVDIESDGKTIFTQCVKLQKGHGLKIDKI